MVSKEYVKNDYRKYLFSIIKMQQIIGKLVKTVLQLFHCNIPIILILTLSGTQINIKFCFQW